jgi:primosomal protein N'
MYCGFCGSKKHTVKNCPKTWSGQANRNSMRCGYCGSKKHNIEACPKTWSGNAKRAWHKEEIENDYIED